MAKAEDNLLTIKFTLMQHHTWKVRLIDCIRIALTLDSYARIVAISGLRLSEWAAATEPVAGIDHTARL
jgi:hypothetical protein